MADGILLRAEGLGLRYPRGQAHSLAGICLELNRRGTLVVIGRSGSGKTTLARCLTLFERPSEGVLEILGVNPARISGAALARLRRKVQLIPQDAAGFLNPRMSVRELLEEPLRFDSRLQARHDAQRIGSVLEACAIPHAWLPRRPAELSGGQRQRVVIARALLAEPDVLVLDEPLAGLDLPAQMRVLNLLQEAQEVRGLGFVFLTHDLAVARHLGGEVIVIEKGRAVERGECRRVLARPASGETRALLAAMLQFPGRDGRPGGDR
jgi:ABC-type glutathione transport system ATPase component